MNRFNKSIKYVLLMGCLLLVLSVKVFPLICGNQAGLAYNGTGSKQGIINDTVEGLIIEGAGYILESNESALQLLRYMELQYTIGMDTTSMNSMIDKTLLIIQKARFTYERLVQTAESTPYNEVTLKLLKEFPYEEFQTNLGLNSIVFQEVATFLRNGDVTGSLKRIHNSIIAIEELLLNFKAELKSNPGEAVKMVWTLNETYAELLQFGSYVARVFAKI